MTPMAYATTDEGRRSPPKMGWLSANTPSKSAPARRLKRRLPSAFASNMLRKKRRDLQFNHEVRVVELDYYLEHLQRLRKTMLGLSYSALAFCLALALCKLAST